MVVILELGYKNRTYYNLHHGTTRPIFANKASRGGGKCKENSDPKGQKCPLWSLIPQIQTFTTRLSNTWYTHFLYD